MNFIPDTPTDVGARLSAEYSSFQRFCLQHLNFSNALFFPPSEPAQRLIQELPAERKFLRHAEAVEILGVHDCSLVGNNRQIVLAHSACAMLFIPLSDEFQSLASTASLPSGARLYID